MDKKTALAQAKELLKVAKENPDQFQELVKKMGKTAKSTSGKSKHDRCVEHVKENSPGVKNPHAVCVAEGVRPAAWKKGEMPEGHPQGGEVSCDQPPARYGEHDGDKSMEKGAPVEAGSPPSSYGEHDQSRSVTKGAPVMSQPPKKFGEHDQSRMKKDAPVESGQPPARYGEHDQAMQKESMSETPQGGEISGDAPGRYGEHDQDRSMEKDSMSMHKDDAPHPPHSPKAEAHDVAEGDQSLHHALKILDTPEKQKAMLSHLRTLHDPAQQRSPRNRLAGGVPAKAPMRKGPSDLPGTSVSGYSTPLAMSELLPTAKMLLKVAKEDPEKFAALTKMSSVAGLATSERDTEKTSEIGLSMAEQSVNRTRASKPLPVSTIESNPSRGASKGTYKCMSKDEIRADMKKDWKPRYMKGGY